MRVTRITVRGVELAVASAGSGDRGRVLLLHGFGGAKEDFADWLDPLATEGWQAVAYDQRGHGQSAHPAGEEAFSLDIFKEDLLAVVDDLGWGRFVLLGHSMGGMVAQLTAVAAPARLAGLILMDTSYGPLDGIDPSMVSLGQQVVREGGMAALLAAQKALSPGPLVSPAHLRLVAERPGYEEFCEKKTLTMSADMWLAMSGEMAAQPDRLAALRALSMPVVVIVGEQDVGFLGPSRTMASAISGARLVVIPDGGHSPQFEAPERWWQEVRAFLSEVSGLSVVSG
jgi:pimeloyl-ACP methyl ester carboxylesterase